MIISNSAELIIINNSNQKTRAKPGFIFGAHDGSHALTKPLVRLHNIF